MRAAGFIASPPIESPVPSLTGRSSGSGRKRELDRGHERCVRGRIPLTEAQKEIWLAAQMGGDAAVAYNES